MASNKAEGITQPTWYTHTSHSHSTYAYHSLHTTSTANKYVFVLCKCGVCLPSGALAGSVGHRGRVRVAYSGLELCPGRAHSALSVCTSFLPPKVAVFDLEIAS